MSQYPEVQARLIEVLKAVRAHVVEDRVLLLAVHGLDELTERGDVEAAWRTRTCCRLPNSFPRDASCS